MFFEKKYLLWTLKWLYFKYFVMLFLQKCLENIEILMYEKMTIIYLIGVIYQLPHSHSTGLKSLKLKVKSVKRRFYRMANVKANSKCDFN